jgi:hypothetical protein
MIGPRLVNKPLVIYGNGKLGRLAMEIFHELHIPIVGLVDKTCVFRDKHPRDAILAICVATEPYNQIIAPLVETGWDDIVPVWNIIEAYLEVGIHNGWIEQPMDRNDHETYKIMVNLADDLSRLHYGAFMDWRISNYEHRDLVIEISKSSLPATLADIRLRQRVDIFADAPMKTISIHNEGCELKTLEENMQLFQKYRPEIDVSCYHSRDGLWKIEKFLMNNLPNYTWTFRLTAYMGQGAYITGCPKERLDK